MRPTRIRLYVGKNEIKVVSGGVHSHVDKGLIMVIPSSSEASQPKPIRPDNN